MKSRTRNETKKTGIPSASTHIPPFSARPSLTAHRHNTTSLSRLTRSRLDSTSTSALSTPMRRINSTSIQSSTVKRRPGIAKKSSLYSSKIMPYSELKRSEEMLREEVSKLKEEIEALKQIHEIRMQQVQQERQELEWNHESRLTDLQRACERGQEQQQSIQLQLEEVNDEKEQTAHQLNKLMRRFDNMAGQLESLGIDPMVMAKLTEHERLEQEREEREKSMVEFDRRMDEIRRSMHEERERCETLIRDYEQKWCTLSDNQEARLIDSVMTQLKEGFEVHTVDTDNYQSAHEWLERHGICFDDDNHYESDYNTFDGGEDPLISHTCSESIDDYRQGFVPSSIPTSPNDNDQICDLDYSFDFMACEDDHF